MKNARFKPRSVAKLVGTVLLFVGGSFTLFFNGDFSRQRLTRQLCEHDRSQPNVTQETSCQVLDIAILVRSTSDAREASMMLKTMFYFRTSPIHLHIIVGSRLTFKIMKTLMDTWELEQVQVEIQLASTEIDPMNEEDWEVMPFKIWKYIPVSVEHLLYINNRMRFVDDIYTLWQLLETGRHSQTPLGLTKNYACESNQSSCCCSWDNLVFYNLNILRGTLFASFLETATKQYEVSKVLNLNDNLFYLLPCHWSIHLNEFINIQHAEDCYTGGIKSLVWNKNDTYSLTNPFLEQYEEQVTTVLINEPLTMKKLRCYPWSRLNITWELINDPCYKFRKASSLKRTHLYFIGQPGLGIHENTVTNDITLLTQTTMDRFHAFERVAASWNGLVTVVLYLSDAEVLDLVDLIRLSKILSRKKKIAYHVVYKRSGLFPVNYLRNVALNNTHTKYSVYVDVDMLPSVNLKDGLMKNFDYLLKRKNSGIVLVVPSFEAFESETFESWSPKKFPKTKSDVLQMLEDKRLQMFKVNKWYKGHAPTNYTIWPSATLPYEVKYKKGYEPFVAMLTSSMPRFNESLLDRGWNKIGYIELLYRLGYEFHVLHDGFLFHMWHPKTSSAQDSERKTSLFECGKAIWKEYTHLIQNMNSSELKTLYGV